MRLQNKDFFYYSAPYKDGGINRKMRPHIVVLDNNNTENYDKDLTVKCQGTNGSFKQALAIEKGDATVVQVKKKSYIYNNEFYLIDTNYAKKDGEISKEDLIKIGKVLVKSSDLHPEYSDRLSFYLNERN